MNKIPFKKPPLLHNKTVEVGNDIVGILEVPVYGYLLVGELEEFIGMAEKIDKLREALTTPEQDVPPELLELMAEGTELIEEAKGAPANALQLTKVITQYSSTITTLFMRYRVNHNWTTEDTQQLSAVHIREIAEIFRAEMTGYDENKDLYSQFISAKVDTAGGEEEEKKS